jgi:hypothetical protein
MGNEDAVQMLKANTTLQDLPMGPFAAINQVALIVVFDYQ